MKTIGITLAAVVLMILVIGFFAMRFLRAEDNDEFEDLPQERIPSRPGGDRDYRDEDYRSQDYPGRPEHLGGSNGRGRLRRSGAEREPRGYDDRSGERTMDYGRRPAGQDERGSRTAAEPAGRRAAAAYETRRDGEGPQRRPDGRPSAAPLRTAARPGGRGQDGEWAVTDWDALSDVDYWAELASDKPLATTAQPASPAVGGRRTADRHAEARPGTDPRAISQPGTDYQQLPVRQRSQPPAAAPAAGATGTALPAPAPRPEYLPAPHSYPYGRPAGGSRLADSGELSLGVLAGLGDPQGRGRPAQLPGDDDPLTSPSLPAVTADDSRSYRNPRPGTPGGSPAQPPYGAATQQFPAPGGSAGRREGYDLGDRQPGTPISWPGGYGEPADASERTGPQQRQGYAPAAAYREHPDQLTPQSGSYLEETRSPRHGGGGSAGRTPAPGRNPYDSYPSSPASVYPGSAAPAPAAPAPAAPAPAAPAPAAPAPAAPAPAVLAEGSRAGGYDRSPAGYAASGPQRYQPAPAHGTGPADYLDSQRGRQDPWSGGRPDPSRPDPSLPDPSLPDPSLPDPSLPDPSRPGSAGERGQQTPLPARSPASYLDGGASLLTGPAADYGRDRPESAASLPVRPAHSGRPAHAAHAAHADRPAHAGHPGHAAQSGRPAAGYRGGQADQTGYPAPDAAASGDGYGYGGYPGYGGLR